MKYYYSGLPYSDEIYHHGIPGMKWGVRRYQNSDGSLTEAGRKRYSKGDGSRSKGEVKSRIAEGAKAAGKVAGRLALKGGSRLAEGIARGVKQKLAEKMPFMLNDEELARYRERLNLENTFRNAQANRRDLKNKTAGDQFLKKLGQDVVSTSVKTVTSKAVNKWADEAFKTKDEREKEEFENKARRQASDLKDTLYEYEESNRKERDRKALIDSEEKKYNDMASSNKAKADAAEAKRAEAAANAEKAREESDKKYKEYLRVFEDAKEASRYGLDTDAKRLYKEAGELFTEAVTLNTNANRYEVQANNHKVEYTVFKANERSANDRAKILKDQSEDMGKRINARDEMIKSNRSTIASLGGGGGKKN